MGPFAFTLRIKNAQRAGEVTFRCDGVSRRSLIENRLVTRAAKVPAEETLAAMSTAAARHAGHMGSSLGAKQYFIARACRWRSPTPRRVCVSGRAGCPNLC